MALAPSLKKAVHQIAEVGQFLWQKGWAEKNAGNLSFDVTDLLPRKKKNLSRSTFAESSVIPPGVEGRSFLITGTGVRYRDIQREPEHCLCLLTPSEDLKGYHLLWGGRGEGFKPTSELASHLQMHKALLGRGGKLKVVVHTHPNELITLTHLPETNHQEGLCRALWSMIPEAKLFVPKGVGLVPYALTGSTALAEQTILILEQGFKVVMWEKHGALAVGEDPYRAFDLVDAMNKAATLYLLCKNTGVNPQGLTEDQIEEIGRTYPEKD
jgi:rhamnulose-1-phosphate aldolase